MENSTESDSNLHSCCSLSATSTRRRTKCQRKSLSWNALRFHSLTGWTVTSRRCTVSEYHRSSSSRRQKVCEKSKFQRDHRCILHHLCLLCNATIKSRVSRIRDNNHRSPRMPRGKGIISALISTVNTDSSDLSGFCN